MKAYLALFLVVWMMYAPAVCWALPSNVFFRRASAAEPAPSSYVPYVATFDGTDDYLQFTASLAGAPETSRLFTFSTWVKFNGGDGTEQCLAMIQSAAFTVIRWRVARLADGKISVWGLNTGGDFRLNMTSTNTVTTSSGWTHILICVDLNSTATRKIYLNGVAETLNVITYVNSGIAFSATTSAYRTHIGAGLGNSPANRLNGSLADLWLATLYLDDPSKFISGGKPVSLGTTGSVPTGLDPILYFSGNGNGNAWTNRTGGSSFTVFGSLDTETAP